MIKFSLKKTSTIHVLSYLFQLRGTNNLLRDRDAQAPHQLELMCSSTRWKHPLLMSEDSCPFIAYLAMTVHYKY